MLEDEKSLMESYGITSETKTVFYYQGHKYHRLQDAIGYAKIASSAGKSEAAPKNSLLSTIKKILT